MRVKQINNLTIHKNENRSHKYYVKTPDGRILEEFDTLTPAESFAKNTKDFIKSRDNWISEA